MTPRHGVWLLTAFLAMMASHTPTAAVERPDPAESPRTDLYGDALPRGASARLGTVRFRHPNEVEVIAYSPDGKVLATATGGVTVYLWDAATGKPLRRLETKEGSVRHLTFSADGKTLAIVSCAIFLADVESGKVRRATGEAGMAVAEVAFSSDGKTLATRGNGIHLWDANTGKELRALRDAQSVRHLTFSPDGKTLAATGSGVRTWDVASGEPLTTYEPATKYNDLTFSNDGQTLALRDDKYGITVLELAAGGKSRRMQTDGQAAGWLRFSPDNTILAASCGDGETIRLFDPATGKECKDLARLPTGCSCLAWAPKGKVLALVSSFGNAVRLWDVAAGKFKEPADGHDSVVRSLLVSPNGKTVASAGWDGTVRLWNVATGRQLQCWNGPRGDAVNGIAFAPDGNTLAASVGNLVRLLDPKTGRQRAELKIAESLVRCVAYAPDGQTLYTAGDYLIEAWDLATNKVRRQIGQLPVLPPGRHALPPLSRIVPSTDGHFLVADGPQGIGIWDTTTGKRREVPDYFANAQGPFALTNDGRTLAASKMADAADSAPKLAPCLWEVASGKKRLTFPLQITRSGLCAFAPDGRLLATTDDAGGLLLLDVATGEPVGQCKAQEDISQIAFSPDGKTLLTGGTDGTILVWDVAALAKLPELPHVAKERLPELWKELAGDDARKAYQAVWAFAGSKDGVAYLRDHLRPVPTPAADVLERLFADLDSAEYARREAASTELAKYREAAAPALRTLLESKPSAEVKRRAQVLLTRGEQDGDTPSAEALRTLRALEALERAGDDSARDLLKELSKGAAEARQTRDAKVSLERLEKYR